MRQYIQPPIPDEGMRFLPTENRAMELLCTLAQYEVRLADQPRRMNSARLHQYIRALALRGRRYFLIVTDADQSDYYSACKLATQWALDELPATQRNVGNGIIVS